MGSIIHYLEKQGIEKFIHIRCNEIKSKRKKSLQPQI